MIAAILVLVSAYFAIRVAMVELFQNLKSVYQKWEDRAIPKLESYTSSGGANGIIGTATVIGGDSAAVTRKVSEERKSSAQATTDVKQRRTTSLNQSRHMNGSRFRFPALAVSHWDQQLAHFKMAPSIHPDVAALRPMMGACCPRCVPTSRLAFADEIASRLGINNLLKLPSYTRDSGFLTRAYHHFNFVFQRGPSFTYTDVSKKVLHSDRVAQAIQKAAELELEEKGLDSVHLEVLKEKHSQRALESLRRMRSCISSVLLRLAKWVLYKLLGRLLNGIHIHKGQIEVLRKVSERKLPIVYLPLHRSHLDYILVTYILYVNNLRAPVIAAGDNLLIPFFGALMRGLGAFFIKRKLDPKKGRKDHVYRAVLHTYMSECLAAGHSLEFFVEGGRSRSGKACMPKAGLMSVVVDSITEGIVEDAFIVPVAISYEKILDGNFVLEQLGKPKVMESFPSAVKGIWSTLHSNFGNVRVDFSQPFSLKEFLQSMKRMQSTCPMKLNLPLNGPSSFAGGPIRRSSSTTSLYGTDVVLEDQRQLVKELAEHVVYDAFNSKALMCTNMLAFLLLNKYRKGATLQQLTQSFNQLRDELNQKKRDVGFSGDSVDAVRNAWSLLGKDLVTTETIQMEWSLRDMESNMKIVFYKPNVRLPYVLELQYYSNALLSVYIMESVVANALFAVLDEEIDNWQGCKSLLCVSREQLLNKALDLCDILQYEFIFAPPCTDLTNVIMETIQQLITNETFTVIGNAYTISRKDKTRSWANTLEANLNASDDDDDEGVMPVDIKLRVNLNEESLSRLQFLRCIISAYIETYWLSACSLVTLVGTQKEENIYFQLHHKMAEERLHQGLLSYEESFAAEPLKNSLKLFEHWGVLESFFQDSVRILYLKPSYDNEESLQEIVGKIEEFKK